MYQMLKNENTGGLKDFKKMDSMLSSRNLMLGDNLTYVKLFLKLFMARCLREGMC